MTLFDACLLLYNINMIQQYKYLIYSLLLAALVCSPAGLHAQNTKNTVKALSHGLKNAAAQDVAKNTAAAGQMIQLQQVARTPVSSHPAVSLPAARLNPTVSRFVNNNKKLLYRLQTSVGISSKKAVENLYKWGANPLQKPRRPVLQPQRAFTAADFSALAYTQGTVPPFPMQHHPQFMYRGLGLALDGKAIKNILTNGLLAADVGSSNNDLLMSFASAGGPVSLQQFSKIRLINLTDSPATALHYGWRNSHKGMVAVVVVKEPRERGEVVAFSADIPAEKIHAVIALLSLDGVPTWCRIKTATNGFRIIPFGITQTPNN